MQRLRDAPETFVIGEEERVVAADSPADRAAELILNEDRLLVLQGLEESGRVEIGIAQILEQRAVKLIGAALQGGVDDRPAGASELGAEIVGLDLEFRHGIGRDLRHLVGEALVAGAVGVVVDSIQDEIVE